MEFSIHNNKKIEYLFNLVNLYFSLLFSRNLDFVKKDSFLDNQNGFIFQHARI